MVEESFSVSEAWSVTPPCYIRKVDRSGHWRDATTIQDKVFRPEPEDRTISVYLINSPIDLLRVAIALNVNRSGGSKTEPIFFVAITADELAELTVRHTRGETLCRWANRLHRDLVVTHTNQIACLTQTLLAAGRRPKKFTKKVMQKALDFTLGQGCYAANVNSRRCVCEDELPQLGFFSWLGQLGRQRARSVASLFGWRNRSC